MGNLNCFTFVDYGLAAQAQTRVWIGDLRARIGECNVSIHNHNADQDLKTVSSDFIFLEYPQVFLKFDRTPTDRFVSPVTMYDDLNDGVEANWRQVRSRDYKFVGNRILENGMLRIVIRTIDPVIEFWGWNFNARFPSWEKAFSLIVDSDNGSQSLQVQNITFDYFTKMQLKATVNFGTSLYSFVMTRGDPYLTVLNKGKLKLRIKTSKNRMGADFGEVSNNYSLVNTFENGNPSSNAVAASSSVIVSEGGGSYFIDVNGLRYTAFNGPNSGVGYFNTSTVVDGESGGLVPFDIHLSAQGVTGYNDRLYVIDHNTAIIIYDTNGVNHGSFALDSDNSNPQGLTLFREKFYVSNSSGTRKLFGYNLDGTRNSSLDISLTWAIIALASTADRLYILRSNARVYVYREDKTLDFSFNLNLGLSSNAAQGMTIINDKLYVNELVNNKIHVFSLTGVRDQSLEIDLVSENTFARGMANLNGVLWVVDSPAAKAFPYYIKATPEVIASRLAVAVNSDSRLGVDVPSHDVNATVNGAVVRLSSGEVGSLGNNIRIDVSNTDNKVYALSNSLEGGAQGDQSETLSAFTLNDNYFGFYNNNVNNEIVGWMSNMVSPVSIDVENVEGGTMYGFVYPVKGNVFGLGILPSYPTNLVGVVPFPFVVGNQDEYIKWRANEALLAFRQLETFKRR